MINLYYANPGDDIIEGVFHQDGRLLGYWSPNDANWRSYFNLFMKELGFEMIEIFDWDDWRIKKLQSVAKEEWGFTDEDLGLT
jgi:hypothetical protein